MVGVPRLVATHVCASVLVWFGMFVVSVNGHVQGNAKGLTNTAEGRRSMNFPEVVWCGQTFVAYPCTTTGWNDLPGIYIFAGLDDTRQWWLAKYVGQTNSLSARLANHERMHDAQNSGATHIHACVIRDASMRLNLEESLIRAYSPPLNSPR